MTDWFDLSHEEERVVEAFMARVASLRTPNLDPGIPDHAQLWFKAALLKKWEAERRASRPLDIMQPIEIAGGLVAAGLLLYWSLPYLL